MRTHVGISGLAARLALCTLLALPLGCMNPFTPASPAAGNSHGVPEDFATPENVLETMRLALQNQSEPGAAAWLHAFADSTQAGDRAYRQFYDGAVKQNWQTANSLAAPEPWDVTLERGLPSQLFGLRTSASYAYQWQPDPASPSDGNPDLADTVEFHRHYELIASTSTSANQEIIAVGFADLSFQKTNGRWSIFRWNDRVDPAFGVNPSNSEYSLSRRRLDSLVSSTL